jgi:transcriptional regulator with XRE-family HTH domain
MNRKAGPVDIEVGEKLKQRRLELGFTQQHLADAIGVKFQQIQKYERGSNRVSSSNLFALANALKTNISYFFPNHADNYNASNTAFSSKAAEQRSYHSLSDKEEVQLHELIYYFNRIKDATSKQKLLDVAKSLSNNKD